MYLSERPRPGSADPATPAGSPGHGAAHPLRGRVASTVVLLGVVSLFTDISSESLSAVLPLYLTAVLGLSPLAYGFIDGLYQGVSALVRILGGWLSDRADRPKWVAFVGYGLSALTKIALIPLHGFAAVTAVITIDRLGKGIRTAPRDAMIAASTPEHALGRAFGVHRALDTAGAAIGPLVAFAILFLVPGDYTSVFVASFAAAVIGLAVLGLVVPDVRPRREATRQSITLPTPSLPQPTPPPTPRATPSVRTMVRSGMGRLVVATALLSILAISDGFLYLSLQQRDDLAATWFPLLFVGTNVAYFALAIPFGRLSDRIGRSTVLVGGHLLLVGAYLCTAGPVGGLAMTLLTLFLLGAFYATTDGVLAALTSTLVPTEVRGVAIATTQTVVALGRFVSSIVFGVLWAWLGRGPAVLAYAVLLACAVPVAWWLLSGLRARTAAATPSPAT
ncbi:MAG: MFS transporter [Lapillicoccus sp.]